MSLNQRNNWTRLRSIPLLPYHRCTPVVKELSYIADVPDRKCSFPRRIGSSLRFDPTRIKRGEQSEIKSSQQ